MSVTVSAEKLATLIDEHLGDLRTPDPSWKVDTSAIAGRGIIACRDIQPGELIFRERALIIGPTARKGTVLNTCVICYRLLDKDDCLCKKGCTLPICVACSDQESHKIECKLFQRWQPIDVSRVNPVTLRILTAVRGFFLAKNQRDLLYSMQANADAYYRKELERAAEGFKNFPTDRKVLDYICRTVSVLNTNAFEAKNITDGHETLLRGLFPLAGVMNHECTPNACHFFDNGHVINITAARFIPKGTEITTTYTKIMWSNLTRRVFLKMTKHFVCECPRCQDPAIRFDWSRFADNRTPLSIVACVLAAYCSCSEMSAKKLARLVDIHLGELRTEEPNWKVDWSPVAGRGVFALRDIEQGELLFRERAVVLGPTARKGSALNVCVVCYKLLDVTDFQCAKGCTLPVCEKCSATTAHKAECELLREWQPIDVGGVNPMTLRILTAVRSLFVSKDHKDLIFTMQANADNGYRREITRAAEGFKNFPTDKKTLDFLLKTVGVMNTNAFEAPKKVDGYEILLRGLFPLTAVMNHECTPNACHYFEDGSLAIVRAARDIPKGAEITTTYTKILWGNLMRRIFLKMTKHFVCECSRCKDPTENETYLAALYCREPNCKGLAIPVHTTSLQPDWKCCKCGVVSDHAKMGKYQDFTLNTIHNRINSCSVRDMIHFINETCPRFCPPSNYVLVEAKLNVIWRMQRLDEEYTQEDYESRDRYRKEVIEILDKLNAGDCTLRKLITNEIN